MAKKNFLRRLNFRLTEMKKGAAILLNKCAEMNGETNLFVQKKNSFFSVTTFNCQKCFYKTK